ncbi:MAG: hypothetical protein JNM20_15410, partial [Rhizobiales bacterium]|nr:hypothetical protein [Hyphomicrobiales bacterium]
MYLFLNAAIFFGTPAAAEDSLRRLPPAVASFATQFDGECKQKGLGAVVASENFRIDEDLDLNGDGKTDYL